MKYLLFALFLLFIVGCNDQKPTQNSYHKQPKTISVEKKNGNLESNENQTKPLSAAQLEHGAEMINNASPTESADIDAKKLYKMKCALCHGFKGNMNVNGAKDLTKSKVSLTESVTQIYYGRGLMTPQRGLMSDAEIVAVAKYVEDFRK